MYCRLSRLSAEKARGNDMKYGNIIAYSGTHDTGKTTAVYDRIGALKREHPDKLIGPHVENLIFCPFPINGKSSEESQLWVFTNHIQAELHLMTRYDIVVSDRSAVDAIAYTSAHGWKDLAARMMGVVRHHMNRYSEIVFMMADERDCLHADGFRDVDPDFRKEVQVHMLWIYTQLGFDFESVGNGMYRAMRG